MKRLFMTFAAMLLMSVSAFAQSNETLLRGDVNGDGVVDVADITAVIGIIKNVQEHYFYLGTVKPTAENYKIIPGTTTSYTSFDEAVGMTVSVDAGQTLYMLCPAQWVMGKTVVLEDNSGETLNFSQEIDCTTVSGYAIYKTQVLTDAKDVTLKGEQVQSNYYWYVGTTQPTTSTNPESNLTTNVTEANKWHKIGTELGTYNANSPLVNGTKNNINVSPSYDDITYYICIPTGLNIYNGAGTNISGSGTYPLVQGNVTIANKQYNIYSNINSDFLDKIY